MTPAHSAEKPKLPIEPDTPNAAELAGDGVEVQSDIEGRSAQLAEEVDDLVALVEADQAAGIDADAAETITALQTIKARALNLRQSFLAELTTLLRKPAEAWKRYQARRLDTALAKPDNPKIIQRLETDLKNPTVPLTVTVALFQRATKESSGHWAAIQRLIDERVEKELPAALAGTDTTTALQLYDAVSPNNRYRQSRTFISKWLEPRLARIPAAASIFLASTLLQKTEAIAALDASMQQLTTDRPNLASEYRDQKRYTVVPAIFSETEQFFLEQPRAAVTALASYPDATQATLAEMWKKSYQGDWAKALLDPQAEILVDLFLEFPSVTTYREQPQRDLVLAIDATYSPTERAAAWEKAGSPTNCSWEAIHTYLLIGHLPQSTPEQIRSLKRVQVEKITAIAFAYGPEKVAELWTADTVLDFTEFEDRRGYYSDQYNYSSIDIIAFARDLDPILKAHLPTNDGGGYGFASPSRPGHFVENHTGFQGSWRTINAFSEFIKAVPETQRLAVFAVLQPQEYISSDRESRYLTAEQATNFLEFTRQTNTARIMQLRELIYLRDHFSEANWPRLTAGIAVSQELGLDVLAQPVTSISEDDLAALEQVGLPEHAAMNQFICLCQKRSPVYVSQGNSRSEFKSCPRNSGALLNLYNLADACAHSFSADAAEMADYKYLDADQRRLIELITAGRLITTLATAYDLPVLEGQMVHLGYYLEKPNQASSDERFRQLTTEQKQRWLFLEKNMLWSGGRDETNTPALFELTVSERGKTIAQFLQTSGLTGYVPETVYVMASRPDCVARFHYLNTRQMTLEGQKTAVEFVIRLHDAGLPDYPAETKLDQSGGNYGDKYDIEKMLTWEPTHLAQVAAYAHDHYPALGFTDLFRLKPTEPLDVLQRRIDKAALLEEVYFSSFAAVPETSEITTLAARVHAAEVSLSNPCDHGMRKRIAELSNEAWLRLSSDKNILRNYLEGKVHYVAPDLLAAPDAVLLQPWVWQQSLPDTLWQETALLQKIPPMLTALETGGKNVAERGSSFPYETLVRSYETTPWLFTPPSLAVIHIGTIDLLPKFSVLSPSDWQAAMPQVDHYYFNRKNEIPDFIEQLIEQWRTGTPILPETTVTELANYVQPIPWRELKHIRAQLAKAETPTVAQLVKTLDANDRLNSWENARKHTLEQRLSATMPTFARYRLPITQLEELSQLTLTTQQRLEQLDPYRHHYGFGEGRLATYIAVAQHANYPQILELLQMDDYKKNAIFDPHRADASMQFCAALTPALVEQIRQWPDKISLQLFDMPHFFASPRAAEIMTFATELHTIFGNELYLSIYNLLMMDTERDLANIRQLRDTCYSELTPDHLRKLVPAAEGDMRVTIERLLALFDGSYKIDYAVAADQLAELDPNLRQAVLREKGPGNFGWKIMNYREQIRPLYATSAEYDAFVCNLYGRDNDRLESCDAEIFNILLNQPGLAPEEQTKRVLELIPLYTGPATELAAQLLNPPTLACTVAEKKWELTPIEVKASPLFWETYCATLPIQYWGHYGEMPATCIPNEATSAHSIDEYVRLGGNLNHLSAATPETANKRTAFEQRFAALAELAPSQPAHVTRLFEKLADLRALPYHYLDTLYAIAVTDGVDTNVQQQACHGMVELVINHIPDLAEMDFAKNRTTDAAKQVRADLQTKTLDLAQKKTPQPALVEAMQQRARVFQDYFTATPIYEKVVVDKYVQYHTTEGKTTADAYIAELRQRAKGIIGSDIPAELRQHQEYLFYVKTVFPDGNYSSYEKNLACGDQLEHLAEYQFDRAGYPTTMTGLLGYRLQADQQDDTTLYKQLEGRLGAIREFVARRGPDSAALQKIFDTKVDQLFQTHATAQFQKLEGLGVKEKMLALFISEIVRKQGNKNYTPNRAVLDLIVEYKYAYHENLEAYIEHSEHDVRQYQDEVSQRYVMWQELSTIYGENIKHVLRHNIFEDLAGRSEQYQAMVTTFGELVGAQREERKLTPKQLGRVKNTFENPHIPAEKRYDILLSQALNIFGTNIPFANEEEQQAFNTEVASVLENIRPHLSAEVFLATVPRLFGIRDRYRYRINAQLEELFTYDSNAITREISKFEEIIEVESKETSMGGPKDRVVKKSAKKRNIRGYFTKTQETANARMGAYVCIAGDANMWKNQNYFEFVDKDEDTGKCVGVAMLLRIVATDGKRYLWMGPNPFESFLTQVSADQALDHMYKSVTDFAAANGFDGVVVPSEDGQILGSCTNRGGTFPDLIKAKRLRDRGGNLRIVDFGGTHTLGGGYSYSKGAVIWAGPAKKAA
ncbi:MAG: hypothetical protein ACD_43C00019G0002 [uncultured bacterium]|nr:MAG: hypothetical protein ACD_43C00019G0002 [uncultured bacterium]